jgi:hypothetical protein
MIRQNGTERTCLGGGPDHINAVMSAVGYNFRLILKWLRRLLRKIIAAIWAAIIPFSTLKPASQQPTIYGPSEMQMRPLVMQWAAPATGIAMCQI